MHYAAPFKRAFDPRLGEGEVELLILQPGFRRIDSRLRFWRMDFLSNG